MRLNYPKLKLNQPSCRHRTSSSLVTILHGKNDVCAAAKVFRRDSPSGCATNQKSASCAVRGGGQHLLSQPRAGIIIIHLDNHRAHPSGRRTELTPESARHAITPCARLSGHDEQRVRAAAAGHTDPARRRLGAARRRRRDQKREESQRKYVLTTCWSMYLGLEV